MDQQRNAGILNRLLITLAVFRPVTPSEIGEALTPRHGIKPIASGGISATRLMVVAYCEDCRSAGSWAFAATGTHPSATRHTGGYRMDRRFRNRILWGIPSGLSLCGLTVCVGLFTNTASPFTPAVLAAGDQKHLSPPCLTKEDAAVQEAGSARGNARVSLGLSAPAGIAVCARPPPHLPGTLVRCG